MIVYLFMFLCFQCVFSFINFNGLVGDGLDYGEELDCVWEFGVKYFKD